MRRTGLSKGGLKFKPPGSLKNPTQVKTEEPKETQKTPKEINKSENESSEQEEKQESLLEEKKQDLNDQKRTREEFQSSLEKPKPKKPLHTPKTIATPEIQKPQSVATYWTCFHTKVSSMIQVITSNFNSLKIDDQQKA